MIYSVLIFAAVICGAMIVLSFLSLKPGQTAMTDGRLRNCPGTPNCVCSEYPGEPGHVSPIPFDGDPAFALKKAGTVIRKMKGNIVTKQENYLHAVFSTPVFRFKDDLEIRIDGDRRLLHIRSASRVGHSDLGANRKRVERFRDAFEMKTDR
jgi:uncharacterized protein (DUF1499 family)